MVKHSAERPEVIAYYAWCMSQVNVDAAQRLRPQPVALLARLGVDTYHESQGLGASLLKDVLSRLIRISQEIGCRGLLVHTESPRARAFYQHLIPEFEESPTDPLHLFLLLKDIRSSRVRLQRSGVDHRALGAPQVLVDRGPLPLQETEGGQ